VIKCIQVRVVSLNLKPEDACISLTEKEILRMEGERIKTDNNTEKLK
jgi:hypothetical protein